MRSPHQRGSGATKWLAIAQSMSNDYALNVLLLLSNINWGQETKEVGHSLNLKLWFERGMKGRAFNRSASDWSSDCRPELSQFCQRQSWQFTCWQPVHNQADVQRLVKSSEMCLMVLLCHYRGKFIHSSCTRPVLKRFDNSASLSMIGYTPDKDFFRIKSNLLFPETEIHRWNGMRCCFVSI